MGRKIGYGVAVIGVVMLPLLIVSIWLWLQFDATIFDHVPVVSDEIFHWHQSITFAEVGLNGGYYSLDENTPIAGYSAFYAWGMFPYVIYGTVARFVQFPLYGVLLTNLVIFMGTTVFFIINTRLSWIALGLFGLLLGTFIPLLIYLPSSLLLLLNLAIAMVLASGFYHLLTREVSWRFILAMTMFTVFAGFIRPTFALFLAPMFALADRDRTVQSVILAGFKALPLVLFSAVVFYTSASPFPHFRSLLILGDDPISVKLVNFGAYIQQSFIWMGEAEGIIRVQHYQFLLLIGLLIGWGIWQTYQTRQHITTEQDWSWGWELALHIFNLVGFYVATITLHETLDGHDYRVMSPHLLFSLLLLLTMKRRVILGVMIASMIIALPIAWEAYEQKAPNFEPTEILRFADWRAIMGDDLIYTPNAPSRWCNTVGVSELYVTNLAGQPGMALQITAGLGITWYADFAYRGFDLDIPERYQIPAQPQARYLILTDEDYQAWGQSLNLERIERAPSGAVYLNNDSACN